MKHLIALFHKGLSWGALESISIQLLLTLHTILLFTVVPTSLYGEIGIIFSLMYLVILCATAGLDSSLGATDWYTKSSRQSTLRIFGIHATYTAVLIVIGLITLFCLYTSFVQSNKVLCATITGIIVCEVAKKTAKVYFSLLGNFKKSAFLDVLLTVSYIITIWSIYGITGTLSPITLCVPLFFSAAISALYGWHILLCHYKNLPSPSTTAVTAAARRTPWYAILSIRTYALLTQSTHLVFSGNVLVPLVAAHIGLQQAGIIKLISNCIHTALVIIEKMFGITSTVLFAQTIRKQYVFLLVTRYLLPIIGIGSVLAIGGIYVFLLCKQHLYLFSCMVSYSAIHINNLLSLTYERLLLDSKKGHIILGIALFATLIMYSVWYVTHCSYTHALMYIAFSRFLYFIGLSVYTFRVFRIKPSAHISFGQMAASIALFILVYFSA